MYVGFQIDIDRADETLLRGYLRNNPRMGMCSNVSAYEMENALASNDANWIIDNWFKSYEVDVFISHSSLDIKLAQSLAAILESVGLVVFIDSEVWGRVENLQRLIDDKMAILRETDHVYSYNKRNVTTSCVHAMLHYALMRMINRAECFMFIGTQNSMLNSYADAIDTKSPWLFHELAVANVIAQQKLKRERMPFYKTAEDQYPETMTESFALKFTSETKRLRKIRLKNVIESIEIFRGFQAGQKIDCIPQFALDVLYHGGNEV